jgi:hypothetical protein
MKCRRICGACNRHGKIEKLLQEFWSESLTGRCRGTWEDIIKMALKDTR